MEISEASHGDVTILSYHDNYCNTQSGTRKHIEILSVVEQRELLLWFKEHRPEMWQEIFCDDCPEVCRCP